MDIIPIIFHFKICMFSELKFSYQKIIPAAEILKTVIKKML